MYLTEILFLLSWPGVIIASYYLILFALKKFEENKD